ncbi:MAG: putative rane protein [Mucilaginibacter sp.]|nr:putative rane protein [Mucilaginibacter sp.]
MKLKISKPLWQVLGVGLLAGMRSASAPAITSHILSHHHSKKLEKSPLNFLQSNTVANVLKVMAIAEFVGDKLPSAPNRIKPVVIAARCLSGALAGAGIFKASGGNVAIGALLGGTTAFASTFGSFFLRKSTVKTSGVIDPIIGAIEDALVIGAGVGLANIA